MRSIKSIIGLVFVITLGCSANQEIKIAGDVEARENRFVDSSLTHFICFNCRNLNFLMKYQSIEQLEILAKTCRLQFNLSNLENLKELHVTSSNFFFNENLRIKNIENISIYNAELKKIPDFILNSNNLNRLHLNLNNGKALTAKIKNLKKIKTLELSFVNLDKLPEEIFLLDSLKVLKIYINNSEQIIDFPDQIYNLEFLETLHIPIDLTGKIENLAKLKRLKNLTVKKFTKFEEEFYKLKLIPELKNISFKDMTLKQEKLLVEIIPGINFKQN